MTPGRKVVEKDNTTGKAADFQGRIPDEWWTRFASDPEALVDLDRLANLGLLTGRLAHDILNPLSAVLNLSLLVRRMLSSERLPRERIRAMQKHLDDAASETARACRLISEIRSFALAAGRRKETSDLNGIVESALRLASHSAELENIRVDLRLAARPLWVLGERAALQHLVMRLLQIWAQILPGGRAEILTGIRSSAGEVFLEVRKIRPPIRRRRTAASPPTDRFDANRPPAGLSAARYICRAHGGRIRIRLTPSGEAACRIAFPSADSKNALAAGRKR